MMDMPERRKPVVLLILIAFISVAGCNRGPTMVQVRGKVLNKDGTTIKRGVREIRFEPTQETTAVMRRTAIGQIQDDGSFELFTKRPGDGVLPGKYAVVISVMRGARDPVQLIDAKYTTSRTTPYHESIDRDITDLSYTVEPVSATSTGTKSDSNKASAATGNSG
jgi:hypothetical protein